MVTMQAHEEKSNGKAVRSILSDLFARTEGTIADYYQQPKSGTSTNRLQSRDAAMIALVKVLEEYPEGYALLASDPGYSNICLVMAGANLTFLKNCQVSLDPICAKALALAEQYPLCTLPPVRLLWAASQLAEDNPAEVRRYGKFIRQLVAINTNLYEEIALETQLSALLNKIGSQTSSFRRSSSLWSDGFERIPSNDLTVQSVIYIETLALLEALGDVWSTNHGNRVSVDGIEDVSETVRAYLNRFALADGAGVVREYRINKYGHRVPTISQVTFDGLRFYNDDMGRRRAQLEAQVYHAPLWASCYRVALREVAGQWVVTDFSLLWVS